MLCVVRIFLAALRESTRYADKLMMSIQSAPSPSQASVKLETFCMMQHFCGSTEQELHYLNENLAVHPKTGNKWNMVHIYMEKFH